MNDQELNKKKDEFIQDYLKTTDKKSIKELTKDEVLAIAQTLRAWYKAKYPSAKE